MFLNTQTQRTLVNSSANDCISQWIEAFLSDQKAKGNAKGTLIFYYQKLKKFVEYCNEQKVKSIYQITPDLIRQYQFSLEQTNHNPGGRHAMFRALRAFLLWYEQEVEPEGWSNPIHKVKAPKVPLEPLEPISFTSIKRMIDTCLSGTFTGERDKSLLLFYLDTGVRAQEGLSINLSDIDLARGEVLIRHGKGNKPRYVYFSKQTRKAIRKYLNHRKDDSPALWVTHPRFVSDRLSYDGLREMLKRRSHEAGIEVPGVHDFRRAFALSMLRNGTDVFTLAKLMGHEGITVLQRYLKQTNEDTEAAHRRASPVAFGLINGGIK